MEQQAPHRCANGCDEIEIDVWRDNDGQSMMVVVIIADYDDGFGLLSDHMRSTSAQSKISYRLITDNVSYRPITCDVSTTNHILLLMTAISKWAENV